MTKKLLYLGTDPSRYVCQKEVVHYPIIHIAPRSAQDPAIQSAYRDLSCYTHWIFTSPNAVQVVATHLKELGFPFECAAHQMLIAIGSGTQHQLAQEGMQVDRVAERETQEGVIELLNQQDLDHSYLFFPRSSLSRPRLLDYLMQRGLRFQAIDIYDTYPKQPLEDVDMATIDEVVFTSPSTVRAFIDLFGQLPVGKKWTPIGPITQQTLDALV